MKTATLVKKATQKEDVVTIPRKEYEALLRQNDVASFSPTEAQKKALARAEKNLRRKATLSTHELSHALGFTN